MNRQRAWLLGILLIAFALRVWHLPQTPPGLWYDEAYNAMDARWMAETGDFPTFFVGNNGREPLWHYLLLLSTSLLGNTPFAVRWVGALAGLITIPIIYRLTGLLLRPFVQNQAELRWLALTAAAWLAVSWWHLLNSRAGFRPILLPPLLMLSLYFFIKAIIPNKRRMTNDEPRFTFYALRFTWPLSSSALKNFTLAGLFLGLSQYTYLPARLAPLIFGGLLILWTLQIFVTKKRVHTSQFRAQPARGTIFNLSIYSLWLGTLITAITALLIFLPLGLFFFNNPDAFFSRTGDVAFSPKNPADLLAHLGQSLTLFLGAGHELYRHHLPGRAMLGWLEIPFFWIGLLTLLRPTNLRRPQTHLLLLGLLVMWLPALLATPPIHALRPIGLLPFYYLIVTLGMYHASRFTLHASRLKTPSVLRFTFYVLLLLPLLNGLLNTYDYFRRWASHPEVYQEFNAPLVDLTDHLLDLTADQDVLIPFHVYIHPTTRYLLRDSFPEQAGPPPPGERPVEMLLVPSAFQLLYVGNIPESPALVLLTRDDTGQGAAYVSRPPRAEEQTAINEMLSSLQPYPFKDRLERTVAQFVSLPNLPIPQSPHPPISQSPNLHPPISTLFTPTPLRTIDLTWADLVRLTGYDVTPVSARPGQPITLNLYWRSLTDKTFDQRLFLQIIDSAGQPLNQAEEPAFREDMYRWRPDGILPTQHTLWLGPETPPGAYLIRLGFFDPRTGERLPIMEGGKIGNLEDGGEPVDQVQLGLFYVTADGDAPRQPDIPLTTTFGEAIDLTGVTIPDLHSRPPNLQSLIPNYQLPIPQPPNLPITLFWQPRQPTDQPYTVFLQLLDEQGTVISGKDRQPLNGLYPTTRWSPGEPIVDTFSLPLPAEGLPPGTYRLISGFYDFETGQRLSVAEGDDFALLAAFGVE